MRIAFVSPGYPPALGGVELVVAELARALSRVGHTVEVFAQERRSELVGVSHDGAVAVHRYASFGPHDFPVAPRLWRDLASESATFDVVHAHSYHALTGLAAALQCRVPLVFSPHYHGTGHSPLRAALHRVYRPIGRITFVRAKAIVCVSQAEARLVAAHFPASAAKIFVVPNGVDVAAIRSAEPFPKEPPTVLSVGRLERYKRVDQLLRAFAALPMGTAQLVIIGAGPDRARLEQLAGSLGACGPVRFLGRVDDGELRRWLRTCRVLCSLSEHEAFGLAPAEALAAGAEVVLSDIPAHLELAAAGPVRLAGPHESAAQLAEHLDTALATKPDSLRECTVADWDEVADQLTGIYQRLSAPRATWPDRTGAPS